MTVDLKKSGAQSMAEPQLLEAVGAGAVGEWQFLYQRWELSGRRTACIICLA